MRRIDPRTVDIRRAALPQEAVPPFGNTPLLVKCPNHADDSESLAIYPDHIVCFGCSFRVSRRLEALAWLLKLEDWKAVYKVLDKYQFLPETTKQQKKAKTARPPTLAEVSIYERLLEDRRVWLNARGLTNETIRTARLGHNGAAFVIPVFDGQHKLVTLRYRNDEEISGKYEEEYNSEGEVVKTRKISKYRGWSGYNDAVLYPAWKFETDRSDYVVLVEGELDALLLWQHQIPAITATNGAGQQGIILDLLREFFERQRRLARRRPGLSRVVICGDRDEPGIAAARKLFERAKQEYEEVIWIQWPRELGKDITELYQKGYTFNGLYETWGYDHEVETGSAGEHPAHRTRHDNATSHGQDADTAPTGNDGVRLLEAC